MSKELAKRLIEEAVQQYTSEHEGLFDAKDKKKLSKDLYCKFLAGLLSLEEIREELWAAQTTNYQTNKKYL